MDLNWLISNLEEKDAIKALDVYLAAHTSAYIDTQDNSIMWALYDSLNELKEIDFRKEIQSSTKLTQKIILERLGYVE